METKSPAQALSDALAEKFAPKVRLSKQYVDKLHQLVANVCPDRWATWDGLPAEEMLDHAIERLKEMNEISAQAGKLARLVIGHKGEHYRRFGLVSELLTEATGMLESVQESVVVEIGEVENAG